MRGTVYPSIAMIPGLDTVLVGEVEEHALAITHTVLMAPTDPFFHRKCGYSNIIRQLK